MALVEKSIEMTKISEDHPETKCGWPVEKYDKWMEGVNKRTENKPFEERRIGWISPLAGYKVCCCGQSVKDFILILLFMVCFYVVNALFCWALWSISSIDLVVTSYIYGALGLAFMLSLVVAISIRGKKVENDYLESLADEME